MRTCFARRYAGLPLAGSRRFRSVDLLKLILDFYSLCLKKMPENTDVDKAPEHPAALWPRV